MSQAERLRRPHLRAATRGLLDPRLVVERWLADAQSLSLLLGDEPGDADCQDAFDVVAARGRLRRADAELLRALNAEPTLAWLEALIQGDAGRELVRSALRVPDVAGWLRQAGELFEECEVGVDFSWRAEVARTLITDLDDAQLVELAARQCDLADVPLAEQLAQAQDWLTRHPETFLAASVWIQSVGFALREDLAESDANLAGTSEKFAILLDEIEEAEADLMLEGLPALPSVIAQALFQTAGGTADVAEVARRPSLPDEASEGWPEIYRIAAWRDLPRVSATAAKATSQSGLSDRLCWESPDKTRRASLRMRDALDAGGETSITLAFELVPGSVDSSLDDLVGKPLTLGGAEARIERREVGGEAVLCAPIVIERMLAGTDEYLVLNVAGETWWPAWS